MEPHNLAAGGNELVPVQALPAFRILVISGAGTGKTTVSTNLASWFAYRDEATVLIDADPQMASSLWVSQRPAQLTPVYGLTLDNYNRPILSFHLRAPKNSQWIITDAPSGLSGQALNDLILDHDLILVPVVPTDNDLRPTTRFISELLLAPSMRQHRLPIAVVANRVDLQSDAWERLQKFLISLHIPYPAILLESQNYLRAYREGQGVVDYQQQGYLRDRGEWEELIQWIDGQHDDYRRLAESAYGETQSSGSSI